MDYLVFLVLFVHFDLQVVVLRVDLVGQSRLLDDVFDELELIKEQEELPDEPYHYEDESTDGYTHHGVSIHEFLFSSRPYLIEV